MQAAIKNWEIFFRSNKKMPANFLLNGESISAQWIQQHYAISVEYKSIEIVEKSLSNRTTFTHDSIWIISYRGQIPFVFI